MPRYSPWTEGQLAIRRLGMNSARHVYWREHEDAPHWHKLNERGERSTIPVEDMPNGETCHRYHFTTTESGARQLHAMLHVSGVPERAVANFIQPHASVRALDEVVQQWRQCGAEGSAEGAEGSAEGSAGGAKGSAEGSAASAEGSATPVQCST